MHNFHRRDQKFSDVPDTGTIFKQLKKKAKNQITSGTVPLKTGHISKIEKSPNECLS